jgi:murein DD-endopeptidase MepM/ murein hydrolase activator NlpD
LIAKRNFGGERALPDLQILGRHLVNWRDQFFPEFQVLFRRGGKVTYINLTARRQAVVMTAAIIALAMLVYIGARFQHFGHVVLSRGDALAHADQDRVSLSQEIAALKDALAEAEGRATAIGEDNDKLGVKFADAQRRIDVLEEERTHALADAQRRIEQLDAERTRLTADRTDVEHRLANAEANLNAKSTNFAQLSKELDHDRDLLRHSDSNQATLQSRVQVLEQQLAKANLSTDQYKGDLANIAKKLEGLSAERDRLTAQHDPHARVADGKRPFDGGTVTLDPPPASMVATEEPDVAPPALATITPNSPVAQPAGPAIIPTMRGSIESMLSSAGLDVGKLLTEISTPSSKGEGGPFVAAGDAGKADDVLRQKQLQKLVAILPLTAPLDSYRFESPFGARADPLNHRRAYHTGVDLSAPYRTHVLSTAPGIVIFAGADGEYGRLVEIDHGHGIVTRYAHLHRTLVVKGQKVPARFAVGELGSTGRSTGPHVHYEVVVDGTPLDPAKFIGAGKNVVQTGTQ